MKKNCKKCQKTRRIAVLVFVASVFGLFWVMTSGCTTITLNGDSNNVEVTKKHSIPLKITPKII